MEQLTRNEQVSGSSPLVGSLFCRDLQVKLLNSRGLGVSIEANLLQPSEEAPLVEGRHDGTAHRFEAPAVPRRAHVGVFSQPRGQSVLGRR